MTGWRNNDKPGTGDCGDCEEVVARLRVQMQQPQSASAPARSSAGSSAAARDGVFLTVDEAVSAAYEAQKKVREMSLEERGRMISIIRRISIDRCEELGRMELEETKVGGWTTRFRS